MSLEIHDVAIIGAGLSGLSAARHLRVKGLNVVVLEKSRGVGGRAATRRISIAPGIEVPVDHGAQFFTARDPRFQQQVARWQEQGVCFPWCDGLHHWGEGKLSEPDPHLGETRYACREGMSQLGKNLSEGIAIHREYQVEKVNRKSECWQLEADPAKGLPLIACHRLMVSAPIPQAMKLVGYHFSATHHAMLERVVVSPCIAVMASYEESLQPPPWHGIQVQESASKLAWLAWDSSRRKPDARGKVAVLHASKKFGIQHLDSSPDELNMAGLELIKEAALIAGDWMGLPTSFTVHRWRYSRLDGPSAQGGFMRSVSIPSLYLIGDGINGGRIEGAWLSGVFAAEQLLLHPC